jgi:hypothetical protein
MIMDILVVVGILVLVVAIGLFGFTGFLAGMKANADREEMPRHPTKEGGTGADGKPGV